MIARTKLAIAVLYACLFLPSRSFSQQAIVAVTSEARYVGFADQEPSPEPSPEPQESTGSYESRFAELERQAAEMNEKLKQLQDGAKKAKADAAKLPSVQINGVFQADAVLFDQDPGSFDAYGRIENGADFRRARLSARGSVTDRMDYFLQMDFGFFGRPTFTDVWVDFKQAGPLGTIRVGQWKQPFSLETVSSFRYTTFMERASVFQAFVPFRRIGVGFYNNAEDFGDRYLHLGLGYYLNAPPYDRTRARSIPEIFVGEFFPSDPSGTSGQPVGTVANGTPFFADTGLLDKVNLINTYGTESLWVRGPFSWQSEVMAHHIDTDSIGNALLWGGYSQIGYFLTGEHRPYDRIAGAIDRVKPLHSVSRRVAELEPGNLPCAGPISTCSIAMCVAATWITSLWV
jgi:phosphate-selective porin OprO/OprP